MRCVGIWRDLDFSGTEFAECSRQRPCGQYRFGGLRMPYRAVHDRTRHAFRHVCAHGEDFVPHRIGRAKIQLDRFQCRHVTGRGTYADRIRTLHVFRPRCGQRAADVERRERLPRNRYFQIRRYPVSRNHASGRFFAFRKIFFQEKTYLCVVNNLI